MSDENLEDKKERMRRYMEADRKLDKEKDKQARRGKRGCLGGCLFGLLKLAIVAGIVAGIAYLIWLWHPWDTEIIEKNAAEHPGICSDGVEGVQTEEYLRVFGMRVMKSGESTICAE